MFKCRWYFWQASSIIRYSTGSECLGVIAKARLLAMNKNKQVSLDELEKGKRFTNITIFLLPGTYLTRGGLNLRVCRSVDTITKKIELKMCCDVVGWHEADHYLKHVICVYNRLTKWYFNLFFYHYFVRNNTFLSGMYILVRSYL